MFDRLADTLKNIFKSRLLPIILVYLALFMILIIRLFNLQIVSSDAYVDSTMKLDEKKREIQCTRGNIYDCTGNLLASNQLSYSVTIEDTGTLETNEEKNAMIYKMIKILYKNEDAIDVDFYIDIDENGKLYFTVDKTGELRFKRDAYFAKSVNALEDKQKNATADEVFNYLRSDVSSKGPKFDISDDYSLKDALDIMKIRYTMMINSYTKYIPITIASNVKDSTVVAIKESSADMSGVKIVDETTRLYYDSKYFSNIIGYTGRVTTDDVEETNKKHQDYKYIISDQIGKNGIESTMEDTLRGQKGSETLVIDGNSRITNIKDIVNPTAGNDVYLTINSEMQKACYDILEKKLAGILISKINNSMDAGTKGESASDIRIPIYDVYNATIENGVLDIAHFNNNKASETEKSIYKSFKVNEKKVIDKLTDYININNKSISEESDDEYNAYLDYIYTMLKDNSMLLKDSIDTNNEVFKKYINNKVSFNAFLEEAIIKSWINFDALGIGDEFYTTSELFDMLKTYILQKLVDNTAFDKLIYKYMIYDYSLSGTKICLALVDQGIVKAGESTINELKGGTLSPYSFIIAKIKSLELTPAMLALEPCSGSVVITNVNTGDVIAYVTYPTYDNNKFANDIDSDYFKSINNNASFPLINRPSMQKTAPGSTFKMVSSTAALEENGILSSPMEKILDKHTFTDINPSPRCWSKTSHGKIDVTDALKYSCNYFFYVIGYRLGLSPSGAFDNKKSLATLTKYADKYGLLDKSGIELAEAEPQISDSDGVRSAIGQSKNSFTSAQLSRYVTTIANSGTCYNLTIIDKTVDHAGNNTDNSAKVLKNTDFKNLTWDYIHEGMRKVITGGSVKSLFKDFDVKIAGKTGTAEENTSMPNHALFVSYAPYDKPEISLTTVIPNGYTSGNAAELARDIYLYYYNEDKRQEILDSKVKEPENKSHAFSD